MAPSRSPYFPSLILKLATPSSAPEIRLLLSDENGITAGSSISHIIENSRHSPRLKFRTEFSVLQTENMSYITHSALHIRDITDAHRVLEAVRLNILPLIKRRLVPYECAQLGSGNVFVWEESEYEDRLVRWTEGRRWSQSKLRRDCLVYEEKIETTCAERQAKAARRAMKVSGPPQPIPTPPMRKDRPSKVGGLTKKTYSVTVQLPGAAATRKWHVVAYCSACDVADLPVIEDYDYLRNIRVLSGVFVNSNRAVNGSLERFPPPLQLAMPGGRSPSSTEGSMSPVISTDDCELEHFPANSPQFPGQVLPPLSPSHAPITLPSLSSLGYLPPSSSGVSSYRSHYRATGSEDRRVLDKFRVLVVLGLRPRDIRPGHQRKASAHAKEVQAYKDTRKWETSRESQRLSTGGARCMSSSVKARNVASEVEKPDRAMGRRCYQISCSGDESSASLRIYEPKSISPSGVLVSRTLCQK
ncbi:Gti1/Pac2 family-domain-containing protein [Mycena epipterygia]|nr:Gti1/Pac2 family-domain-containing protein [Mycena epipterygia]